MKKYFVLILSLAMFFMIGIDSVDALESGVLYDVDLGTVNVGYTDVPRGDVIVHNNGTEAWNIMRVETNRDDIFSVNGTFIGYVYPAYDSYGDYYVSAKEGLPAGVYTAEITVTTWSMLTMSANVTLRVVDPNAFSNVSVTSATDFVNAINKSNVDDSFDLIKLDSDINMGVNDELNWHIYKDTVLDLNGNTLTLVNDKTVNLIYHDNATFKMIDSSVEKTGKIYKKKNDEIFYFFTVQENDTTKKHNIAVLVDGVKIERGKQPEEPSTVFKGKSDYKLTVKNTTLSGLTYLLRSDDNVRVDLSIETIELYTYSGQSMAVMARNQSNEFEKEMLIGNVIPEDSEFLYYNINDKQVVADRNRLISEPFVDSYDDDKTRSIIVRKKVGFDVKNVSLNEVFGYIDATDVRDISIYNSGAVDLQIKSVLVDSSNFVVEGPKSSTVAVGETNTSFKIKAKEGLKVGEYTANVIVTDINNNDYTAIVTLKVDKKEITDLDISIDNWTYGVDDEKMPVINYGSTLTKNDGAIRYASLDSDYWTWRSPTTAGKYKMKFKLTNDANEKYIIPEKIVSFEIFKNDTEIKIVIKSNSWEYDGKEHKEDDYDVYYGGTKLEYLPDADAKMYELPNKKQDRLLLIPSGKVKDVSDGTVENGIFDFVLLNRGSYSNVTIEKGKLFITPITKPIVVTANSVTKSYDGEELVNNNYTYTNDVLLTGDQLSANIKGSQMYVGTSSNKVEDVRVTRDGKDITSNYTFGTHVNGTLEVKQSSQIITAEENLYVKVGGTLTIDKIKELLNCNLTDYKIKYIGGSSGTFDETTGFTAGATTGKVEMEVIAPAKDEGGDSTPEYTEARQTFYINVVEKETVTFSGIEDNQVFIYNGEKQKPIGRIEVIGGNVKLLDTKYKGTGATNYDSADAPKNAGTYTVTYSVPEDNSDYVGSVTYAFEIKKFQIKKNLPEKTTFEYDGKIHGYDYGQIIGIQRLSGDLTALKVGNYSFTWSLVDKNNYEWEDGTTDDITVDWSIIKATTKYTVPKNLSSVKGKVLSDVVLPEGFTWDVPSLVLNAGKHKYKATYTPKDTNNYNVVNDIDIEVDVKDLFDVMTSVDGGISGGNGSITPSKIDVIEGSKVVIEFIPNTGYMVDKVLVNGSKADVDGNKLELIVNEEKEVVVSYKKIPFIVTVKEVKGANVVPNGAISVNYGDDKEFIVTANTGYRLIKVLVNGIDKTSDMVDSKLILSNITSNMKLEVVVKKIVYNVVEGANQKYVITKNNEARFKINADYGLFDGKVYVDNVLVDSNNYTSESGSTIITFKKNYVDSLSLGAHTLKVVFSDGGAASTKFVVSKYVDNYSNPDTFDKGIVYICSFIISCIGLVLCMIYKKRLN